jgi:hypothetical protein
MSDLDDLNFGGESTKVAHEFEVDLKCLIIVNHHFTLEGIAKAEDEELAAIEEDLALEGPDVLNSIINGRTMFYAGLREAAHNLAWVGVVTRFHHWITGFVRALPTTPKPYMQQPLAKELETLNKCLGKGPFEVQFFKDLVTVRDSVIHGDSRSEWEFPVKNLRRVADRYVHPGDGDLELSEEQLKEAIEKVVQQVEWYDRRLHEPGNKA